MTFLNVTWVLVLLVTTKVYADFQVSTRDLTIIVGDKSSFNLYLTEPLTADVNVTFDIQHPDLIRAVPSSLILKKGSQDNLTVEIQALRAGSVVLSANATPSNIASITDAFVRITVEKSAVLDHISSVVGWLYFLAWSVSFYPQILSNYRRKSVVGLNFDFLSLNLVGFVLYSLFNCGLYWIPEIEQEYFSRYPKGLNPVKPNDIFFSLHAFFATVVTILQCFIYEIGTQRVSTTARIIHGIFTTFILISIILSLQHVIAWIDFLYYCSYVKLAITLIKYVPQAFYNYKRKSTVGWSIGNIFLDFTGGTLSMLQMILNAYNFEDWESIFGDPTKFGLGFFSVAFDVFFIIQHYCLYGNRREGYIILPGSCQVEGVEETSTSRSKRKSSSSSEAI